MSRKRKMDSDRDCPKCGALILAGERYCTSLTHDIKDGRSLGMPHAAPVGSLSAAHFYHLAKSVRNGSWAQTGYRAPQNLARQGMAQIYQEFAGGFTIGRGSRISKVGYRIREVGYALYRMELAYKYWRVEFYNLVAKRLHLWFAGCRTEKVRDYLQLSVRELEWLDGEINNFCKGLFRREPLKGSGDTDERFLGLYRKCKAGWAADVIRRWQHDYKQGQVLPHQPDSPFSCSKMAIYEGKTTTKEPTNVASSEESDDESNDDLEPSAPEPTDEYEVEAELPDETGMLDSLPDEGGDYDNL